MKHLIADLMRYHDPLWTALVPLVSLPCLAFGLWLLHAGRMAGRERRIAIILGCACAMSALHIVVFYLALRGSYPQIEVRIPVHSLALSLAISFAVGLVASWIATSTQRSARNVLLAGSLIATGFSCTIFICMSGVVAPFALSYDLTAVLVVMLAGSALVSFSLWENGHPTRARPFLYASVLGAAGVLVLSLGSMSSILSFRDWLTATAAPDDITSSPIVVIAIAEGSVVLALTLVGSLVDNRTAQRDRLEAERLHQMADATFEAIVVHRNGLVIDGNANLPRLMEAPLEEIVGRELASFIPAETLAPIKNCSQPIRSDGEITTSTGRRLPVEIVSRPITHRNGPAVVTALRDISERHASEARIRFLAHYDMLTDLPNRVLLSETLEQAVWRSRTSGEPLAVMCLDLDGFKLVNDTHGHAAGDELLRQVAFRIRACLGEGEFAARIGGDEFVVLQPGRAQPQAALDLAERLVDALAKEFRLEAGSARIGTSVGIAIHPDDALTPDSLLKRADVALYRAKLDGRGMFHRFDAAQDERVDQHQTLERDLSHALARGEIRLVYQPIFGGDGRIICFEALMRWTHAKLGAVSPVRFIPLAEERGLIGHLGEWALREACLAATQWSTPYRVAVNVSPIQILRDDFVETVRSVLRDTGLAAERLELELTESRLVGNLEAASATLERLRGLGVRLVLDDFGAGASSLSYLNRLPFHKLKVDRQFISHLEGDASSRSILRAVIALGRDLGLEITAEGVENEWQTRFLRDSDCDELQGFHLGRPIEGNRIQALIVDELTDEVVTRLREEGACLSDASGGDRAVA